MNEKEERRKRKKEVQLIYLNNFNDYFLALGRRRRFHLPRMQTLRYAGRRGTYLKGIRLYPVVCLVERPWIEQYHGVFGL